MALFSFGQKKPLPRDQRVFSVLLSEKTIQTLFWEVVADHLEIISQSELKFFFNEADAVIKFDECLQELGPESEVVTQVLFHLDSSFNDETGKILTEKENFIHQLAETLDLRSIGYASNAEALVQVLENTDNSAKYQLIVDISNQESNWLLYSDEKNLVNLKIPHSHNSATDFGNAWMKIQTAIQTAGDTSDVPLQIIFSSSSLLQTDLLAKKEFFPAKKQAIEIIGAEEILAKVVPPSAVAFARASGWLPGGESLPQKTSSDSSASANEMASLSCSPEKNQKQLHKKINSGIDSADDWTKHPQKIAEDQVLVSQKDASAEQQIKKQNQKRWIFLAIFGGLIVAFLIFLLIVKLTSTVSLMIKPAQQSISKDVVITIDPTATALNYEKIILPGNSATQDFSGKDSASATGKKEVGDPAKGKIDLLNKKVGEEKKFSKGTILTADGMNFVLDSDVTLAGASQNGDTIKISRTNTAVTAVNPGEGGNLNQGTKFKIGDYNTNEFEGEATENFSGGTSEKVAVVTEQDQTNLATELAKSLIQEAETTLASQQIDGQRFIALPAAAKLIKKEFSADIDEETDELTLTGTLSMPYLSYQVSDLQSLGESILSAELPASYSFNNSTPNLLSSADSTENLTAKSKVELQANISNTATADLDPTSWAEEIAGLEISRASSVLKAKTGVGKIEIIYHNPLYQLLFKKNLPHQSQLIKITVTE